MKALYTCILAVALPLAVVPVAFGQQNPAVSTHRPALLRFGIGPALLGTGDYICAKTYLEYAPQFGQHLRLGSRLAMVGGGQSYEVAPAVAVPQSYLALNLEQEAYWLPFGANQAVEFGVGGGGFVGYTQLTAFTHAGYNYADQRLSYVPRYERGFHAGYIVSLNLDVAFAQSWRLGGRLAVQNDTFANVLPSGQLVLSRAL